MRPLGSLPRFGNYDEQHDPGRLRREGLMGIDSFTPVGLQSDSSGVLASWLGVTKPVTLDVVGFDPYAEVVEDVVSDPASNGTRVELNVLGGRDSKRRSLCCGRRNPIGIASYFRGDGIGISAGFGSGAGGYPGIGGSVV